MRRDEISYVLGLLNGVALTSLVVFVMSLAMGAK